MHYHPEVLRLFVLQSHYKSPLDFSADSLAEARASMGRFYETLKRMDDALALGAGVSTLAAEALSGKDKEVFESIHGLRGRFVEAMDDDFNTARALGYLFDSVRMINGYLGDPHFTATPRALFVVSAARDAVREIGGVLGLFLDAPADYFQKDRDREVSKRGLEIKEIERLVEERKKARHAKDWKQADEIRNALAEKGITLKDEAGVTTWSIE
jgi:cysteinyl-tRNA synthetase